MSVVTQHFLIHTVMFANPKQMSAPPEAAPAAVWGHVLQVNSCYRRVFVQQADKGHRQNVSIDSRNYANKSWRLF